MASNIENKPTGEEEEDSMSMLDVLQEEKQLEEDADAILGGSDSSQCTYSQVVNIYCKYIVHMSR